MQDFAEGEVIFRDPPLVAAQHSANKADALVCAHCFRYVGCIEQQLQHRILGDAVDTSAGEGVLQPSSLEEPLRTCVTPAKESACVQGAMQTIIIGTER